MLGDEASKPVRVQFCYVLCVKWVVSSAAGSKFQVLGGKQEQQPLKDLLEFPHHQLRKFPMYGIRVFVRWSVVLGAALSPK